MVMPDIESQSDGLMRVPQKAFQRDRFLIMKILARYGEADFSSLKEALGLTDGNLASHLRALEAMKYVEYRKGFEGRRTRTVYSLTPTGLTNFQTLVHYLNESLSTVRIPTEALPGKN
jgi:DNA-binding MarR family transcriptional regulator